jgi:nitroreductase
MLILLSSHKTVNRRRQKNVWTSKQTYLAMGNLLNVAAELKIDVSPMEGLFLKSVMNC